MKSYLAKRLHILPAFMLVSFGSVVFLALARWLFAIRFPIPDIREEVWVKWAPMVIPLPALVWLWPRLRRLALQEPYWPKAFSFAMTLWLMTALMSFSFQQYLTTATAKIQTVATLTDIGRNERTRYYVLKKFSVVPQLTGVYVNSRTSGRYNQNLHFDIYFAVLMRKDSSVRHMKNQTYWYGVKFSKRISNRLSAAEKKSLYKAFADDCLEKMRRYDFYDLDYFERKPASNDRINFLKAVKGVLRFYEPDDSGIVLEPVKGKYANRNDGKLKIFWGSFIFGSLFLLLILAFAPDAEHEPRTEKTEGSAPEPL